jgi:hypothetical protein
MDEMAREGGKKFNTQSFADLVNGLGCPPKQRGGSEPRKYKPRQATTAIMPANEPQAQPQEIEKPIQKLITKGLHLEYNDDYTAEQLNKIFTKLQLLVDGEESKFSLSISLTERA